MILILSGSYTRSREIADELGCQCWRHVDGRASLSDCLPSSVIYRDTSGASRRDCGQIESEAADRGIEIREFPQDPRP